LNGYLYNQQVRLDVPLNKITGLYLPHSSLLDILVFFGIIGFLLGIIFIINTLLYKSENGEYKYLLIFLLINILKSDSMLYINSLILLAISFQLVRTKKIIKYE